MKINIHAGHNPEGRIACGAVGLLDESRENRRVKNEVVYLLRQQGHEVYDCTVDDGVSQADVLEKIVRKCNAHEVDLDISIHFNSGRNDYVGDGSTGGTEVFIYSVTAGALTYAQAMVKEIADLGFRIRDDRIKDDVKTNPALYVLKNTKAPALLIECCFVDDKDDVEKYDDKKMAQAIVAGITKNTPPESRTISDVSYLRDNRKSNVEVAKEVIAGKWGTNPQRRTALTKAGYRYADVQQEVNAMLKTKRSSAVFYYPKYQGKSGSIVRALNELGVNSSFKNRKVIAVKNSISKYTGTAEQNIRMLTLLKQGRLMKM